MIVSALIYFFSSILLLLMGTLYSLSQAFSLPVGIESSFTFIAPYFSSMNYYLPIDDVLTCIALWVSFEATLLVVSGIFIAYKKVFGR